MVRLAPDASDVARVAQCQTCGRAAELRGDPARLRAEGWGSRRATGLPGWPRVWLCPDCYEPAALEPRVITLGGGGLAKLIEVAYRRSHAKIRQRLEGLVRRLVEVDPELGEAVKQALVYRAPSKRIGRQWREVFEPEAEPQAEEKAAEEQVWALRPDDSTL